MGIGGGLPESLRKKRGKREIQPRKKQGNYSDPISKEAQTFDLVQKKAGSGKKPTESIEGRCLEKKTDGLIWGADL